MNPEKKKAIVAVSILIVILGAGFFVNKTFNNKKTNQEIYQMTRGTIVELKSNNSIVVEGEVGLERKRVEFAITPQTILKNNVSVFPKGEIQDGKVFQLKTELKPGKQSDFAIDLVISKIESREDLSNIDKATATVINYSTDEF